MTSSGPWRFETNTSRIDLPGPMMRVAEGAETVSPSSSPHAAAMTLTIRRPRELVSSASFGPPGLKCCTYRQNHLRDRGLTPYWFPSMEGAPQEDLRDGKRLSGTWVLALPGGPGDHRSCPVVPGRPTRVSIVMEGTASPRRSWTLPAPPARACSAQALRKGPQRCARLSGEPAGISSRAIRCRLVPARDR